MRGYYHLEIINDQRVEDKLLSLIISVDAWLISVFPGEDELEQDQAIVFPAKDSNITEPLRPIRKLFYRGVRIHHA